jgi:3-(3-hydroxy-phenyl)propionate hydroxylase
VERAAAFATLDLRWKNKVVGLETRQDGVRLSVETPEGLYDLAADWVIAADGARSAVRDMLGLEFSGHTFEEKFLIVDVRMHADDIPTERRFWFDPPFHSGQSALLHRQPDDCWRVDLQLGPDADVEEELKPERYLPRIERMLDGRAFSVDWISIYRFNCRRIDRFVHDRVIFVGDSAHQISPFGARGANSGIQDADNLGWKLAAVLRGEARLALLDSYDAERTQAADENIGHSTRSTDFIAPRSPAEHALRNAVLTLAPHVAFARRMVNSGRLSVATVYDSSLSTPDETPFAGTAQLGAPVPDAPVTARTGAAGNLLQHLTGGFQILYVGATAPANVPAGLMLTTIGGDLTDHTGLFGRRFDAAPGSTYLIRPDQHLAARWRSFDAAKIAAAHRRALAADDGNAASVSVRLASATN